jgi:predicted DNA-binding transcriptional regulator AlpA
MAPASNAYRRSLYLRDKRASCAPQRMARDTPLVETLKFHPVFQMVSIELCRRRGDIFSSVCPIVFSTKQCISTARNASLGSQKMSDDDTLADLKVIDEREAARLNGVSLMTWIRMRNRGETPPLVQLSPRRIGYRVVDVRRWQDERLRK